MHPEQTRKPEIAYLYGELRKVDLPQHIKELCVRCTFEAGEISHGRAAELLECSVMDIREKGWVQDKWGKTIHQLEQERDSFRKIGYEEGYGDGFEAGEAKKAES